MLCVRGVAAINSPTSSDAVAAKQPPMARKCCKKSRRDDRTSFVIRLSTSRGSLSRPEPHGELQRVGAGRVDGEEA